LAHRAATDLGMQAETIVRAIGKVSYAEAEEFFLDVLRRKVLAHPDASMAEIIRDQIRLWERRAQGKRGPGGEGEHDAGSPGTPAP
jgi:hypothetical protein